MQIYSLTFLVNSSVMLDWVNFTTQQLYKDLQHSPNYTKFVLSKVKQDSEDGLNFNLQIYLENPKKLHDFETTDLMKIKNQVSEIFGEKVLFFCTQLDVIAQL